jgi:hypothetical protein
MLVVLMLNARSLHSPVEFRFTCSSTEGAVLVLPNGASSEDLYYLQNLEGYIRQHALSLCEHAYGLLGSRAEAGLYLITGHEKCNNWGLGSYSNAMSGTRMSLTFTPTNIAPDGTVEYEAHVAGNINKRVHKPEGDNPANQCVFLRGYKLTLCSKLMERIIVGRVRISEIVPPKPGSEGGLGGTLGASLGGWVSWLVGGNRVGNQAHHHQSITSEGTHVVVESFPNFSEVRFFGFWFTFSTQFISPSRIIH